MIILFDSNFFIRWCTVLLGIPVFSAISCLRKLGVKIEKINSGEYKVYGKGCRYCNEPIKIQNMVCDHIMPISLGGTSTPDNLQLICNRCNRRKGPLTHRQFSKLLVFLKKQSKVMTDYILRKLSKADVMS